MKPELIPPATASGVRRSLLDHYDRTARDLPWRRDTDPYRVLVSEFMLQQTRVETVIKYYEPWLERFPSVEALAAADEDQVLKAWEGLGYYRRARNLHKASQIVAERYDGAIPSDPEALRALPGVGEYTTGAVSSIAFGIPAPAVDGNVRRVFARLFDEAAPTPSWLRVVAGRFVSEDRPGDWTQALMELGATVCTPRTPACDECPVVAWCAAHAAGTVDERPAPPRKREVPTRVIPLAVYHTSGKALVQRRPANGLLAGLWAFPELNELGLEDCALSLGLTPRGDSGTLPDVEHRFTHLHARYVPAVLEVEPRPAVNLASDDDAESGAAPWPGEDLRWIGAEGRSDTALPVAQRKVFESWLESME